MSCINNNFKVERQPIMLIGDIAFSGIISSYPERNNEKFSAASKILKVSSLVFANLETPIRINETINEYKNFIHYSLPAPTAELLKLLNIGCVSIANNHIYDCKMPGLKATINLLDDLGIYHTGLGWKKEHIEPVIINNNGINIGFLAYVDMTTNSNTNNFPGLLINYFEIDQVIKKINELKNRVDKIIFSIHWGNDYSNYYTVKQKILAYKIIDAGADIIMGHHPHSIQAYEIYNGKMIFYSLGQLCFGDFMWEGALRAIKRKTKLGMIAKFNDTTIDNFEIIPTKEKEGNNIIISNINIERRLKHLRFANELKIKYKLIDYLIRFKEAYIDRIYEFLFGYYRNPVKEIFKINNLKKLSFMPRDFKSRQ